MRSFYLPGAAAALFVTAALVACRGLGGYSPSAPEASTQQQSANEPDAVKIPACTAPKKGPGTYLVYSAAGKVKGSKFKALTGKPGDAGWVLLKYTKVKPTPTPTPAPSESPSPTPAPEYFYYGTFAMKNKQTGCAYLEATKNGKNFRGANYNGLVDGVPNIVAGHYSVKIEDVGLVSSLTISGLSSKGGTGSAVLVTSKGKPYTTGSIALKGRLLIKVPDDAKRLFQALSAGGY